VNETFTLGVNYDFAKESGTTGAAGIPNWWGAALYAHWKPFDFVGLTLRGEYMDDDGSRVASVFGPATTNFQIGEGTGTLHFYLSDGWETRFEVRHDQADRAVFARTSGAARKFQDTLSAEVVYAF